MILSTSPTSLTCSDALPEDQGFLFQLYAGTRTEELETWGWDIQQLSAFLKMQFRAQQTSYSQQFPEAKYQIILLEELPIGAMLVNRNEAEIHLVDIALLSEYRDRGIGSLLLQNLLAEATQAIKPVRLQVKELNRALQLYQRLGFSKVRDDGVYWLMEWLPSSVQEISE